MGACCTKEEAIDSFEISRLSIIKHLDNLDKEVIDFSQKQTSTQSFEVIKETIKKVKEFRVILEQIDYEICDLRNIYNTQVQKYEGIDLKYKSDQINELKTRLLEINQKLKSRNDSSSDISTRLSK
jgi:hypothetical protein